MQNGKKFQVEGQGSGMKEAGKKAGEECLKTGAG